MTTATENLRKPKYTPGRWTVEDPIDERQLQIVEAEKETHEWRFIASIDIDHERFAKGECEANARLIAAAPELLACLERLLETHQPLVSGGVQAEKAARAAIAKAKGGAA